MTDRWTTQEKVLLAVICGVVFLDTLDLSLVQVALPSIGSALHLAEGPLQWIVSAFVLGYGGFLLLGGRCADVLGRRRVLLAGLVALAAASALGTVASDGTLLIATRFIKGVSAPSPRRRRFRSSRRRSPRDSDATERSAFTRPVLPRGSRSVWSSAGC